VAGDDSKPGVEREKDAEVAAAKDAVAMLTAGAQITGG